MQRDEERSCDARIVILRSKKLGGIFRRVEVTLTPAEARRNQEGDRESTGVDTLRMMTTTTMTDDAETGNMMIAEVGVAPGCSEPC